jgi:HSP20 family protein
MSATQTIEKKTARQMQAEPTHSGRVYLPAVDIVERDDELTIIADMPGTSADGVDVQFENGLLTIYGRVAPRDVPESRCLLCEYGLGDFRRTFEIGELIDSQRIAADYADGVLTVHLPKVAAARPRKIEVRAK